MASNSKILGKLIGKTIIVEEDCYIGENVEIISDYIHIKRYTNINGLKCHSPDKFIVGECTNIGINNIIKCRSFESGKYLWLTDNLEIGRGGCSGPNSIVKIGDGCMICENVLLNPSEAITIGNNVGIGTGVHIWTHGSFLDVLSGFPSMFKSVKIGNDVWLPDKIIVLPGVKIGNNIVIQANSVINKNLQDGCLAGGAPVEILAKNIFPKKLTQENKKVLINEILNEWYEYIVPFKNIKSVESVEYNLFTEFIILKQHGNKDTSFNTIDRIINGYDNEVTEDLRDFLRRKGIKFFTGKPFKSIVSPIFL